MRVGSHPDTRDPLGSSAPLGLRPQDRWEGRARSPPPIIHRTRRALGLRASWLLTLFFSFQYKLSFCWAPSSRYPRPNPPDSGCRVATFAARGVRGPGLGRATWCILLPRWGGWAAPRGPEFCSSGWALTTSASQVWAQQVHPTNRESWGWGGVPRDTSGNAHAPPPVHSSTLPRTDGSRASLHRGGPCTRLAEPMPLWTGCCPCPRCPRWLPQGGAGPHQPGQHRSPLPLPIPPQDPLLAEGEGGGHRVGRSQPGWGLRQRPYTPSLTHCFTLQGNRPHCPWGSHKSRGTASPGPMPP